MGEKIINLFKTQICRILLRYKIDENTWVFSSTDNNEFNYNSKYMFEYIIKSEPDIKPYYIINDDDKRNQLNEKYGGEYFISVKNIDGIKKVLSSKVWFTSAGMPLYGFYLNRRRIIINLWHGVPIKKIAVMENNYSWKRKIYFRVIFSKNYSYILTTSKNLISIMKDSFLVKEDKIKVWGQPRNDVLFYNSKEKNMIDSLYTDLPEYNKLIIYAPTYRDNSETILFPFDDFDKIRMEEFLEYHKLIIFIKIHISDNVDISKYTGNRIRLLDENKIYDIMEVLNIFDVLITDYSSIYIDYLLLQRPIIFLPYDREKYLYDRGMNFEYDLVTPGPKPNNMNEFFDELKLILEEKDEFKDERNRINNYFNDIKEPCSGNICSNIKLKLKI